MKHVRSVLRWAFGLVFIAAGINHFVNAPFYVAIMPSYLPLHDELVWVSGVVEVLVGVAVCAPQARPYSGWAAIATLVAVFPANIHMALHPEVFPDLPEVALWIRLPLQAVFIAWAWWATQPGKVSPSPP